MNTIHRGLTTRLLPKVSRFQVIFFLLWPFGMLIHSLNHYHASWAKTIFWLFCIYFGFVFIYADPSVKGGADSSRYAAHLIQLYEHHTSFSQLTGQFYRDGANLDVYGPLVTWLVAFFTNDPRFLFALFAAVFGFFYAQNIWMVLHHIDKRIGWVLLIFILTFAFVNPLWKINGVRFWTASQIFVYGILMYFLKNERKGLFWCGSAIFVHFSFVFPIFVLLLWFLIPKNATIFLVFYLMTAFLFEVDISQLRNVLSDNLPPIFQPRIEGYMGDNYAQAYMNQYHNRSWHIIFSRYSFRWVTYLWIFTAFVTRRKWKQEMPLLYSMFAFALLMGGFVNIIANMPSGGRFASLANAPFYALFIVLLGSRQISWNLDFLKKVSAAFLAFSVLMGIRMAFDYIGVFTVVGNPCFAFPYDSQLPFIDFIKQLL